MICTLYYTPMESGFTAERGFDVTMETRPGLNGNMYPRDFLRAVKLEGYGRITTPVKGKSYIAYDGGRYVYDSKPKGRGITPLEPRASAAVKLGQTGLEGRMELKTSEPTIERVFGSTQWKITDTGGGLKRWQLDLYWGEDEPRAPESIGRPRSTDFEYAYSEVKIRPATRKADAAAETPSSSPAPASTPQMGTASPTPADSDPEPEE